ncbi:MAG TPA: hypothetical protein VMV10_24375 [Pirellulales bacterium]|nr:hypothetical protein [Pirellulales bacterium]
MTSRVRRNHRQPPHDADEIERLYVKLLRAFYEKPNRKSALAVAATLKSALAARPEFQDSIRAEEIRSLLAELHGDLAAAARCREAEIRKILELYSQAVNTTSWEYVHRQYGFADVADRLDLLAALYDKQGDTERAIATLRESKHWCESHQVPFDGQDLLDELSKASPAPARRQRRETAQRR